MRTAQATTIFTPEHENKWVALSRDHKKVLLSSESLLELKKAVGKGDVVYMKVPPGDVYLSF
jgi:hypothetical protein